MRRLPRVRRRTEEGKQGLHIFPARIGTGASVEKHADNRRAFSDSFSLGKPDRIPERSVNGQGENLFRRRYQKGQLLLLGEKQKRWFGTWYEDVIEAGRVRRIRRQEFLGTFKD